MLRFTYGERKIFSTIQKSQNIMNMVVALQTHETMILFGSTKKLTDKTRNEKNYLVSKWWK